jgi:hypothetical protein
MILACQRLLFVIEVQKRGDLSSSNANPPAPPTYVAITNDPADQIGMPMGYDNGTIVAKATADGLASFYDYSQGDRKEDCKNIVSCVFCYCGSNKLTPGRSKIQGLDYNGFCRSIFFCRHKSSHGSIATYDAGAAVATSLRDAYVTAHPLVPGKNLSRSIHSIGLPLS